MRVLVLGGYGVIGAEICCALIAAGHDVVGLGRSTAAAKLRLPDVGWITRDLRDLQTTEAWRVVLAEARADVIINAAGVLQDGARDDVVAVQETAMLALYAACGGAGVRKFVQISATRATADASTVFMSTKGRADDALRGSTLDWIIFRPGLVIARDAYGGTALVRALAAMPLVTVLAYPESRMQTVDVADVAAAAVQAVEGHVPERATYDLVEDGSHSLRDIVVAFRAWLGLPPQRVVAVPDGVARLSGRIADVLGRMGWRSPLRSTAMEETIAGVAGDPGPWRRVTGAGLSSLNATLRRRPSTVQERWFARLYLLLPVVIGMLSLFWIVSGLVGLARIDAAKRVLDGSGLSDGVKTFAVASGAVADVVLGVAILWRWYARRAALGMVGLSLIYLAGGTVLTPHLWADPKGPLVKVLPAMMLALVAAQLVDDR